MAGRTRENKRLQSVESAASDEVAHLEAYDYWGYLLRSDKCGTPALDRLLKGIAEIIVSGGLVIKKGVWRADTHNAEQEVRT